MQSFKSISPTCRAFAPHSSTLFGQLSNAAYLSCRQLHTTKTLYGNAHHKTRFEILCELNKKLYIHRNSEFGPQPIFYRGPRRVDLYQMYLDKLQKKKDWMTFRPEKEKVTEKPVDDVYLTTLYKPKIYSIKEAVETLKEYVRLDLTDTNSAVCLKLGLKEITTGKGKRKKTVTFAHTTRLPHPSGESNKIAYFTTDEAQIEAAKELGVHLAGSSDITVKILNDSVHCDLFFTSPEYSDELSSHGDLKRKLGKLLPDRKFGVVSDVTALTPFMEETIYHNRALPTACDVRIGKANQETSQLEENLYHVLQAVHEVAEEQNEEEIITSADLSCHTEPIPIDISFLLNADDV